MCKLYELNDQRLIDLQVKGDLIVPKSDRIVTRSRAKQTPDEYTMIPAQLKIIKVLVEELLSAVDSRIGPSTAAADVDDGDEDGDEWEDDPDEFLDLGTGMTKSQLMALGDDDVMSREHDDQTQMRLLEFFRNLAQKPGFEAVFNTLSQSEQEKLRSVAGG